LPSNEPAYRFACEDSRIIVLLGAFFKIMSTLHAPITITSGLHNADTAQIFMRNVCRRALALHSPIIPCGVAEDDGVLAVPLPIYKD
jgi:hypothetical protein